MEKTPVWSAREGGVDQRIEEKAFLKERYKGASSWDSLNRLQLRKWEEEDAQFPLGNLGSAKKRGYRKTGVAGISGKLLGFQS